MTTDRPIIVTWDKLNSRRGFPWDSNPWVWAVTFRKVETQ
jgi:hypothetical protein